LLDTLSFFKHKSEKICKLWGVKCIFFFKKKTTEKQKKQKENEKNVTKGEARPNPIPLGAIGVEESEEISACRPFQSPESLTKYTKI
jgi:ribosomal protein S21